MNLKRVFSKVCVPLGAILFLISLFYLGLTCYGYTSNWDSGKLQTYTLLLVVTWVCGIAALIAGCFANPKRMRWVLASLIILSISIGLFSVNQTAITDFLIKIRLPRLIDGMFGGIHLLYAIPTLLISVFFYIFSIKRMKKQGTAEADNTPHIKNGAAKAQKPATKELVRHIGEILVVFFSSVSALLYLLLFEFSMAEYFDLMLQQANPPAEYFGFINWPALCVPLIVSLALLIASYFLKVKWIHWQYLLIGVMCIKAIMLRVIRGAVMYEDGFSTATVMFFPSQIVFFIPLLVLCIWLFVLSIKRNERNDVAETARQGG